MIIEVFQDVLCPWCYIGKRKLDSAIGTLPPDRRPEVTWRAFSLIPDAPQVPGRTVPEAMAEYLPVDKVPERVALIEATAAAEGLRIDMAGTRQVSSFDAQRLVKVAARHGRAAPLLELLLHAHFVEHRVISSTEVLSDLAAEAGLPSAEASAVLTGSEGAEEVRADHRRAARLGVTGVPSYVIGDSLVLAGQVATADHVRGHAGDPQRRATGREPGRVERETSAAPLPSATVVG